MDGVHAFGPGSIGWALTEHYWMSGDTEWFKAVRAADQGQRPVDAAPTARAYRAVVPGGERLWCKGLQPALQVTPDSGGLWMQFYECRGLLLGLAGALGSDPGTIDPDGRRQLAAEAEAYRKDLRAAVDRSIALSPVVPVRDGTYHSVIPFACYVRGLGTGAWGWQRDGSGDTSAPCIGTRSSRRRRRSVRPDSCRPRTCGCRDISTCWKIACSWRIRMSAIGAIGSTPVGSIRAGWNVRRICTLPATTSRSFSARS